VLFNSVEFIFLFLPVILIGYFGLRTLGHNYSAAWLCAGSLFFYGWWDWRYIWLLLLSIAFHFIVGRWIFESKGANRKRLLLAAIGTDLAALVYFKYADMFVASYGALTGTPVQALNILLPLGISFFTFTQIAYLVDVYEGRAYEKNPIHFGLFVTYFPHLIAGPVLHHKEMMPQFKNPLTHKPRTTLIALGLAIFAIGLAKKVLVADNLAPYANALYRASPEAIGFFQAWQGALAYAFQLYFDFSGYSDMAVGLSLMLGVKLPVNFLSPYKAKNISEFWRRWHMTLSRFLRDYLYIRLGGNRHGRYINLLTTMFLGGLWHGAGWNFALWGLLHGLFLCVHEGWRAIVPKRFTELKWYIFTSVALTFFVVTLAWVPFRAPNFASTMVIWKAMFGLGTFTLPEVFFSVHTGLGKALQKLGISSSIGGGTAFVQGSAWILIASILAFGFPNVYELTRKFRAIVSEKGARQELLSSKAKFRFRFTKSWVAAIALLLGISLLAMDRPSEFLYFQF
jgi:alginate O-acetyltransferase complex protein AlgI